MSRDSLTFPVWLKKNRLDAGLSMNLLAQRAGTTHVTVSTIESGKAPFSKDMVKALARAIPDPDARDYRERQNAMESDALISAGYLPDSDSVAPIVRVPDQDAALLVQHYSGLSTGNRLLLSQMAARLAELEQAVSVGGVAEGRAGYDSMQRDYKEADKGAG